MTHDEKIAAKALHCLIDLLMEQFGGDFVIAGLITELSVISLAGGVERSHLDDFLTTAIAKAEAITSERPVGPRVSA